MNISITLDDMNFDLELDVKPGYYKPAKLTGDPDSWGESESQEHEFDIESVSTEFDKKFTGLDWEHLSIEEKDYFNALIMKANQLRRNDYSDKERSLILARIDEELESERKYE